jgi:hypothetical protein
MGQQQIQKRSIPLDIDNSHDIIIREYRNDELHNYYRLGPGYCEDQYAHHSMMVWILENLNCGIKEQYWDLIEGKTNDACGCHYSKENANYN